MSPLSALFLAAVLLPGRAEAASEALSLIHI